jgi:2'-5' RNA ligase
MEPSTNGHPRGRSFTGFYSVVTYVPEPLGGFLDNLRAELVPGCRLRSHVTILPPRRLPASPREILSQLQLHAAGMAPFDITLGEVELFESTRVAYLSLFSGRNEVESLHRGLNEGALASQDGFPFHPHLTIAQEIEPGNVARLLDQASRRWQECPHNRRFAVRNLTLVRNVSSELWETVGEFALPPATLRKTA